MTWGVARLLGAGAVILLGISLIEPAGAISLAG